ncbi:MAG: NAD(P)H-quinone oxidoreductase subunit F, partial [Chloroflexi bacterium]|nr:NAD(P)H-quinone oxidoreductase subunit F [Chloroflexota bacterium]
VLAYSTISQLGYMMLALGVGGYVAGIFHLFNHALFKALLFLGSGSVSHATGGFDMAKMGGLRRSMPVTFWTFLIASLSLAGIPPLSGFWSKDEILAHTLESHSPLMPLLGFFALATVFLTAFYMTRAVGLTFFGQYRGGEGHALTPGPTPNAGRGEHGHGSGEPHESPALMTIPLLILAVGAVISWVANAPFALAGLPAHWLEKLLSTPSVEKVAEHGPAFDPVVAGLSTLVALAGIGLASSMYLARRLSPDTFTRLAPWLHGALVRKYGFDVLFEDLAVRRSLQRVLAGSLDWFDRLIVDGMVNLGGAVPVWLGRGLRPLQNGQVAAYGFSVFFGALVLAVAILLVRLP